MSVAPDPLHRLRDVFPPGFDSTLPSGSNGHGPYTFTPGQFYETLTYKYNPEDHIESLVVNSAWYGKQKKWAGHEFILIEVEDTKVNLKNFIVLDRNNSRNQSANDKDAGLGKAGYSQMCQGVALDAYRVSYNGIENQLLQECQLLPRQYLEKIEFSRTEPFFLYQLVTLVHVISRRGGNYDAVGDNCYWFAGQIWECLRKIRPREIPEITRPKKRGRLAILRVRYIPDERENEQFRQEFKLDMVKVEERLRRSRQRWRRFSVVEDHYNGRSALATGSGYIITIPSADSDIHIHDSPQSPEPGDSVMDPDRGIMRHVWGPWYRGG